MKKSFLTLTVTALFAAVNMAIAQEEGASEKSFGGMVVGTDQFSAKVKDVNQKHRKITLENPEGKKMTFKAGPEVQNFDQIKKGDTVNITFTESVAVTVSGAGATPSKQETLDEERAPKGEKPSGSITETMDVYGVVTDIDREKRTATLKGPDRTIVVKAKENQENFNNVKVGDNVHVRYTEKFAIDVTK